MKTAAQLVVPCLDLSAIGQTLSLTDQHVFIAFYLASPLLLPE
ncbi:hypothetical protein [Undibacterium pigrum]|nr:hypothetical protein [Undibacterium pigrum]